MGDTYLYYCDQCGWEGDQPKVRDVNDEEIDAGYGEHEQITICPCCSEVVSTDS